MYSFMGAPLFPLLKVPRSRLQGIKHVSVSMSAIGGLGQKCLDTERWSGYRIYSLSMVSSTTRFLEEFQMGREKKMVYVSEEAHGRLKLLAARRNRPMGEVVEDLVAQELADLVNPWTGPEGLMLQQSILARIWNDPALEVYDHD